MDTITSSMGVSTRLPSMRVVRWEPWYSRVVGKNRSTVRTTTLSPASAPSSSSPRSSLMAVKIRSAPKM